jgi:competence protein ComEC
MLFSFLLSFGRWRWLREMLIVVGIWAYVFLTGLSPSAVRAAVMITIYSVVSVADRNRMSLNALALAALVMWMANPLSLYDVGFQMSFMAVLAILVLYPAVFGWVDRQWLNSHRIIKWTWAMVVLSCCAQVGVAPLTAYYFGRFSVYFLLTNFAVIPLATLLLYLSVALVACMAWPAAAAWVAKLLALVASWQNAAVQWISQLPGSHIEHIMLNRLQVFLIYVCMAALIVFTARCIQLKKK